MYGNIHQLFLNLIFVNTDKAKTSRAVVELLKKYHDIGYHYPLSDAQKRALKKHKQKQVRQQQDMIIQSQETGEALQFPVPDEDAFEWTDDLKQMGYRELIRENIKYTMHLHRRKVVQKLLTEILIPLDERFSLLKPQAFLKYFYSDHNSILKKIHEQAVVESELLPYQKDIFAYIHRTKLYEQITSMNSDES